VTTWNGWKWSIWWLLVFGYLAIGYWHLGSIWLFYWPKTCKGPRCFKLDPTSDWFLDLGLVFFKKLAIKKLCLIFATPGNMNMASSKPKYEFAYNYWTLEISLHIGGRGSRPSYKQASCGGVSWHFRAAVTVLFFFGGQNFKMQRPRGKKKKKSMARGYKGIFWKKILNIR